jgi:hypothetical protein
LEFSVLFSTISTGLREVEVDKELKSEEREELEVKKPSLARAGKKEKKELPRKERRVRLEIRALKNLPFLLFRLALLRLKNFKKRKPSFWKKLLKESKKR